MTRALEEKGKRKASLSVGGVITGGKTSLLSGMYMYMNVAETAAASQQQAVLDHFFSMNMETLAETMTTKTKMLHTQTLRLVCPVLECQVSLISRAPSTESCDCTESQLCVRS